MSSDESTIRVANSIAEAIWGRGEYKGLRLMNALKVSADDVGRWNAEPPPDFTDVKLDIPGRGPATTVSVFHRLSRVPDPLGYDVDAIVVVEPDAEWDRDLPFLVMELSKELLELFDDSGVKQS